MPCCRVALPSIAGTMRTSRPRTDQRGAGFPRQKPGTALGFPRIDIGAFRNSALVTSSRDVTPVRPLRGPGFRLEMRWKRPRPVHPAEHRLHIQTVAVLRPRLCVAVLPAPIDSLILQTHQATGSEWTLHSRRIGCMISG